MSHETTVGMGEQSGNLSVSQNNLSSESSDTSVNFAHTKSYEFGVIIDSRCKNKRWHWKLWKQTVIIKFRLEIKFYHEKCMSAFRNSNK